MSRTDFTSNEIGSDGISFQALYGELAADPDRNALIAANIADAVRRGRHSLALSNRIEHLHRLYEALQSYGVTPMLLHGGLTPAERTAVRTVLDTDDGTPLVLLAIDKVAGQGFDAPRLDALPLASPVKFKGKSIQQVGRVMRQLETGKDDIEVHDYLDSEVSRLENMHHYRRRILERKGFTTRTAPPRHSTDTPTTPVVAPKAAAGSAPAPRQERGRRASPKSAPGPATKATTSPNAAACAPTSGTPGTAPTQPDRHGVRHTCAPGPHCCQPSWNRPADCHWQDRTVPTTPIVLSETDEFHTLAEGDSQVP